MTDPTKRSLQATVEEEDAAAPSPVPASAPPPAHKPPTLDLSTVAQALAQAHNAATNSPGSPMRYNLTCAMPRSKRAAPSTIGQSFVQSRIPVDDILHHEIKARAVFWMNRAFIVDKTTMVLQTDVYDAYRFAFAPHPHTPILPYAEMVALVLKMFKGTQLQSVLDERTAAIRNLAWKGQPTGFEVATQWTKDMALGKTKEQISHELQLQSVVPPNMPTYDAALQAKTLVGGDELDDFVPVPFHFTEKVLKLGRRLEHVREPARTRMWIRMMFERGQNEEIEESSLWVVYEQTFKRCYDERPHLRDTDLVAEVLKVFPNAEDAEVAPEVHVIYGMRPRQEPRNPSKMLTRYTTLHHQTLIDRSRTLLLRLEESGTLTLRASPQETLNEFQAHLLAQPLLSLPLDGSKPSPWLQRIRARKNGKPFEGDQPGFPGIGVRELDRQIAYRVMRANEAVKAIRAATSPALPVPAAGVGAPVTPVAPAVGKKREGGVNGAAVTDGVLKLAKPVVESVTVDVVVERKRASSQPPERKVDNRGLMDYSQVQWE